MPSPKKDESKEDFISRCISDLADEGKYKDNDQRIAICYSIWDRKDEVKTESFKKILGF